MTSVALQRVRVPKALRDCGSRNQMSHCIVPRGTEWSVPSSGERHAMEVDGGAVG